MNGGDADGHAVGTADVGANCPLVGGNTAPYANACDGGAAAWGNRAGTGAVGVADGATPAANSGARGAGKAAIALGCEW